MNNSKKKITINKHFFFLHELQINLHNLSKSSNSKRYFSNVISQGHNMIEFFIIEIDSKITLEMSQI